LAQSPVFRNVSRLALTSGYEIDASIARNDDDIYYRDDYDEWDAIETGYELPSWCDNDYQNAGQEEFRGPSDDPQDRCQVIPQTINGIFAADCVIDPSSTYEQPRHKDYVQVAYRANDDPRVSAALLYLEFCPGLEQAAIISRHDTRHEYYETARPRDPRLCVIQAIRRPGGVGIRKIFHKNTELIRHEWPLNVHSWVNRKK
jgi:hypothetical protein